MIGDGQFEESNVTLGMNVRGHKIHGHIRLPRHYFDCVHMGVAAVDMMDPDISEAFAPDGEEADDELNEISPEDDDEAAYRRQRKGEIRAYVYNRTFALRDALWHMEVTPTDVLTWEAYTNHTGWRTPGWAARFCFDDLAAQGFLGSGPGRERWKRATLQVEKVGRRFDQQCIMQWYPHEWGAESPVDDPLRHTSVIQEVVTIRSMVQKLRSLGVAHRVNAPLPEPDVIRIPSQVAPDYYRNREFKHLD